MTNDQPSATRAKGHTPMSEHSRRHFIRNASIGAAAVGATAVIPTMTSADAATPVAGPAHDGPFAVWVKDVKSGEIAVLVGESEVVHHDKALATALARIAARG